MATSSLVSAGSTVLPRDNMQLVFADDFDRTQLAGGAVAWNTTFVGGGRTLSATTGEKQIYLDDNSTTLSSGATVGIDPFTLSNGILTISAQQTPADQLSTLGSIGYTSGLINTAGTFDFRYGFVEMRAQLPAGQGFWPAFWLRWADGGRYGEADIMEMLGNRTTFTYSTLHYNDSAGTHSDKVVRSTVADLSSGFHTFGLDWTATSLTFYVDGVALGTAATPNALKTSMYILANLAVGGWAGNPDATTPWPGNYQIDYIRVYQSTADLTGQSLTGTDGAESLSGGDGNDVIAMLSGNDTVYAGRGDDSVAGGAGNDRLLGDLGNDTLEGGTGADTLIGGGGNDTYIVDSTFDVITEAVNGGVDTVRTALSTWTLTGTLENLVFTGTGNAAGTGNALANSLTGNVGTDTLIAGAGNDTLDGRSGHDKLNGGSGDDIITGGAGNDTMTGDIGNDVFTFSALDGGGADFITDFKHLQDKLDLSGLGITSLADALAHTLVNTQGNLVITLGTETITLQGIKSGILTADDFIFASAVDPLATPMPDATLLTPTGTAGITLADTSLTGSVVKGTAGNDVLGGNAADTLSGGLGHDVYVVTEAGTSVTEIAGGGIDTVRTTLSAYTLGGNVENLVFTGAGSFRGVGNGLDNILVGGNGHDSLVGGAGNDTLYAAGGNDRLNGGAGNDVLIAGPGAETMTGDLGADTFLFTAVRGGGTALITDFHVGEDHLDLKGLGLHSMADVTAATSVNSSGFAVIAAHGETVTLQGVKVADLHAGDFIF